MQSLFEKTSNPFDSGFRVAKLQPEDRRSNWFYHNEFELCYVIHGSGKRFIGNNIEKFQEHDLVLIGKNLIHRRQWVKPNGAINNNAIVIQFQRSFLSDRLLEKPEMISIFQLIGKSKSGINFNSDVRMDIGERMKDMLHMDTFDQMLELLKILKILSESDNQMILSLPVFSMDKTGSQCTRINFACEYLQTNFQKKISLAEVAEKINMTVPAFCRYFKRMTNKTFYSYVIEARIAHACMLLIEKDISIADICFDSGYNNVSIFNRHFKSITGITPLKYRQVFGYTRK